MESRETIKSRMLRHAAREWGYAPSEMESAAFDPVVSMLMGACAGELEKLGQEIHATQTRAFERLLRLMLPEVLTGPLPAHAILHARAGEPQDQLKETDQFSLSSGHDAEGEVIFSPVSPTTVVDGGIAFLAFGDQIRQIRQVPLSETFATAMPGISLPADELWLGVELHPAVLSLEGLRFFFSWRNDPDQVHYHQLLPLAEWAAEGLELTCRTGLAAPEALASQPAFRDLFNPLTRIEQLIREHYDRHFVTVHACRPLPGTNSGRGCLPRRQYPECFPGIFPADSLQRLPTDLIWLRIRMPRSFPPNGFLTLAPALNAVPVMNRRLIRRHFPLAQNIHYFPLESAQQFLAIRQMSDSGGRRYSPLPEPAPVDAPAGTYSVRTSGVGRLDERSTSQAVSYVLDLIRDETTAFAARGQDLITTDLRALRQLLARLENNLDDGQKSEPTAYAVVRPLQAEDQLTLEYWSTKGAEGNRKAAGSLLQPQGVTSLRRDELMLLTSSEGGRNKLGPQEQFHRYREAVLTHDRILTTEDIKAACWSMTGPDLIAGVDVCRGVKTGSLPHEGLMRTIAVRLHPKRAGLLNEAEWAGLCRRLEMYLQNRSIATYPIHVTVILP